jgi:hypothetical protein
MASAARRDTMRHGLRQSRPVRARGYRPPRAWLGSPGDGVTIRPGRSATRRRGFRWVQLRILLLALLVAAIAWPLVLALPDG